MLRHTFCHVPGIGAKTESRLWDSGLRSWQEVIRGQSLPLSTAKADLLRTCIAESAAHLDADNPNYFYHRLASSQHWRMFPEFRHAAAYLDIETTGLDDRSDYITAIGLYDGRSVRHYVHGENLSDFKQDVARYRLIVTYNGKTFDLPFLRSHFGLAMDQAHIDLRYVLASLGYRGGLKGCERRLGLDRKEMADVDGFFAVLLWRDFRRNGNRKALETLLAYNALDVVNLATLMAMAYNMKIKDTPFGQSHGLPLPRPPKVPFHADAATIERIKAQRGW